MEDDDDHEGDGEFMDEDDRSSVSEIPDPSIDFDLVYSLHAFVATVEGQANVAKGDSLFLMDDSNSYWWLVRVLKSQEVGYIPAENIETPYERLARLNKHRNIDLASATQQERTEDTRSVRERDRRQRYGSSPVPPPKSVVFGGGSNQVFNYPPAVWNVEEFDGDEWDEDDDDEEYEEAYEGEGGDHETQAQASGDKVNPADFDPDDGMSWDEDAADEQIRNKQAAQQQQQTEQGATPAQARLTPGAQQAQLGLGLAPSGRQQGSRERLLSGQSQQSQQTQESTSSFDPENITETKRVTATPAIARDSPPSRNPELQPSGAGLQLGGQSQRPSQEEPKRSREGAGDSDNGDDARKRGKDNRPANGDRKLRKERGSDPPDTDGESSGKESKDKDKDKKKKGGMLSGLFGRNKKEKKEKDNGRRPAMSAHDSETSLATRESDDSMSYTTSPPETSAPVFSSRRGNSTDPKRATGGQSGGGGDPASSQAATLRMQRADQELQARFQQSFARSPTSQPDPALAFGTQSAATQLRNLHTSTHNGRPGSLILLEGNTALPELSVLRVFAGERVESEATFKTVLVNADTTSTKLVHQAMQRFRLANAEDASEYYLTVKAAGGAEAELRPDEKPLLVFEAEQARAPTVKRSSVGSINSIASNLSAMPAIAKLGMNDFADDSAVKFYLNRRPSGRNAGAAQEAVNEDVTLRAEEIRETGEGDEHLEKDDDTIRMSSSSAGTANGRPHLSVSTAALGTVSPERFTSPSARFSVQVVIFPEDLPESLVFDPHTEAIVPRSTLRDRSQAGAVASPGISQTQRRKVLNFPKNTTVAEVIEASLERFGILEGMVEGGDAVEDKMSKRRSHSRVRYGLSVQVDGQSERDLLPSSKVLDAFPKQPTMRVIDRRSGENKRRSADSAMLLGMAEDIQRDDPVFVLRRSAGVRSSIRSSTSRYSTPLDEVALQQAAQRESVSDASVASDPAAPTQPQPMTRQEIIAAQRAASRANQRAMLTAQANSEQGVDVLLPDRATLRSARTRADERMRYSYVLPDGETYDISEIVERELRQRTTSSEGGDLLEGVMDTPRNVMEEKLDRVLTKIRDDKSNGRLGVNTNAQMLARQSPSATSRSSHHRHGSDASPRLGSSPQPDSDYYHGRSPTTPPTTVEARGPARPILMRDDFGMSGLMAVVELTAALKKPPLRPPLSTVDELLFGPTLSAGDIHPALRDIYESTLKEMQDVDRQLDQLLQATFHTS